VLPNAWDVASARLFERLGFPAVATASAAVAASLGYPDDDEMPADEAFAVVDRIASAVSVPVTADLEAGYGLPADELVERLLAASAVGLNIEDTDHRRGGLVDPDLQAERVNAIDEAGRARAVEVVVNARVDVAIDGDGATSAALDEAAGRARLYLEAGADCVYPIHAVEERTIGSLVEAIDGPVNYLVRPGSPSLVRLAALGVARVSFGPGLQRVALGALERFLGRLDPSSSEPVYRTAESERRR
jgi:2-methylisocitrate lyase-like PEP mutase family enzyme